MSEKIKQAQEVGDRSVAVVAGGDVSIIAGLDAGQVIDIFNSLFRANFLVMKDQAADEAWRRAQDFLQKFLASLEKYNKAGLAQASNVGFQLALFNAQKNFACSGDCDVGDVLVDLLVERTKVPERDLLQIVIDQSLETAPKLTRNQVDALGIIFLLRHTAYSQINSKEALATHLDTYLRPLTENFSLSRPSLQHMEFAGCGTIGITSATIPGLMLHSYNGLFHKGIHEVSIDREQFSAEFNSLIVPCPNGQDRVQVGVINIDILEREIIARSIQPDEAIHLRQIWGANVMSEQEVAELLIGMRLYMRDIIPMWKNAEMSNFPLTSVGMALGHASLRRKGLEMAPLSTWIA